MNIYDYSLLVGIHKKKETFGFPQKSVSLDHKLTFDSSKEQQDSGTPRRHTMERLLNQTSLPSITPEKFYNNYLVRFFPNPTSGIQWAVLVREY
jgi:hypothetical protein